MGATCTCYQKRPEDELLLENSQPKQETLKGESQEHEDDNILLQDNEKGETDQLDHVQQKSYGWEDNKPSDTYALPVTIEEESKFDLAHKVKHVLKRLSNKIKQRKPSPYLYPDQSEPYKIVETEDIYVGQWYEGKPFGLGCIYYNTSGDYYNGYSENLVPNGDGIKIWKDGSYYVGNFEMGNFQGQGKLVRADNFSYDGLFKNNLPHGKGAEEWPNKTKYNGDYVDGKKTGNGQFTWEKKTKPKDFVEGQPVDPNKLFEERYDGDMLENQFHGQGTYEWEGRKYEGQWVKGKMQGKGKFSWAYGSYYEGDYMQDMKHGYGTFVWPDKKKLTGNWKFGKIDGVADLEVNGKVYQGEWKNGKKIRWLLDQCKKLKQLIFQAQISQPISMLSANSETGREFQSEVKAPTVFIQENEQRVKTEEKIEEKDIRNNQDGTSLVEQKKSLEKETKPEKVHENNASSEQQIMVQEY